VRFITIRDLRNKPAKVWKRLSKEKEAILTSNGKPVAILTATTQDTFEESLSALRRARAISAVDYLQSRSIEQSTNKIRMRDINKVIKKVRRKRRS
jgi:prevent-host-death family protein